jgi:hypothetical protein
MGHHERHIMEPLEQSEHAPVKLFEAGLLCGKKFYLEIMPNL